MRESESARILRERNEFEARIRAAHEALAIDEFDADSCPSLEATVEYAVQAYRRVCASEAVAADRLRSAIRELRQAQSD